MVQTPRPQSTRGEDRTHNLRLREPTRFHCATRACQALSVAQLVEHVTVDVCDHRVAGSIPAAESLRFTSGRQNAVDDEGFEPSTFRMQNGRSTTELNAPHISALRCSACTIGECRAWLSGLVA